MCSQTCGIIAALCSCVFHGTFVCPMKSKAATSVDVDPLVFQTYKVCMCFILSWLVLLIGVEFVFTPWGLVSGLLWIPGGSAGIYAVRTNGIAISVGIWSCISVLTSTMWGFLAFGEKVKSDLFTILGVIMLIIGVIGLSFSSAPDNKKDQDENEVDSLKAPLLKRQDTSPTLDINDDIDIGWFEPDAFSDDSFITVLEDNGNNSDQDEVGDGVRKEEESDYINICGLEVSRFFLGVFCAFLNGVNSGSVLVPMHYSGVKGLEFAPSFAIGALNALVLAWLVRFLYHYFKTGYMSTAFYTLPSMHLRKMLLPGAVSGTLWQIGSIGGMLSVSFFGQGIGMSIGQSSLVVSGLWGIFYFKEVVRSFKITSWFASAIITIAGVYVLCQEHKES